MLPASLIPENFIAESKDKKVLKKFKNNPGPSGLLTVYRILKNYDRDQEAFELLAWGVVTFPAYLAARVRYSGELYDQGLLREAWDCLNEGCPKALQANVMGQKLRFKLAVLCGYEASAGTVLAQTEFAHQSDHEVKRLGRMLQVDGISRVREEILKDFELKGTEVLMPEAVSSGRIDPALKSGHSLYNTKETSSARNYAPLVPDNIGKDPSVRGYFVSRLSEVFSGYGGDESRDKESPIDSPTIAEIYLKQGHLRKALQVYRNLLAVAPGHEQWLLKVREIKKCMQDQEQSDLTPDPSLVHKWEAVREIDKKARFYNSLLEKLQGMDTQA